MHVGDTFNLTAVWSTSLFLLVLITWSHWSLAVVTANKELGEGGRKGRREEVGSRKGGGGGGERAIIRSGFHLGGGGGGGGGKLMDHVAIGPRRGG